MIRGLITRTKVIRNKAEMLKRFSSASREQSISDLDLSKIYEQSKDDVKISDYEENYEDILAQLSKMTSGNEKLAKVANDLMNEMRQIQISALDLPQIQDMIDELTIDDLMYFSIKFFVGSITCPKNTTISNFFIKKAKEKASTEKKKSEILFYDLYFKRLLAIQNGNKDEFDRLTNKMVKMSEREDENVPAICKHLVAKEMYKVALNTVRADEMAQREELMAGAFQIFAVAAQNGVPSSFYYLGEMSEYGEGLGGSRDYQSACDFYKISASFDYPRAYFRLAQMAKNNIILTDSEQLEYIYTKKAAELGLVEAQHNLGVLYFQGFKASVKSQTKSTSQVKALTWFMKAGSKGYPESKYNAAMILVDGTECNKVKKNKNIAEYLLNQLENTQSDLDLSLLRQKIRHIEE